LRKLRVSYGVSTDMTAFSLNLQTPNFIKIDIYALLGFYSVEW